MTSGHDKDYFTRVLSCCADRTKLSPMLIFERKTLALAMQVHPQQFPRVYQTCLAEGRFPNDWKKQRLVLLPKFGKSPGEASSSRFLA